MSKITVKHFLNTNIKPYYISGEPYYGVYVLIIVSRQNTKVKSLIFNELYREIDFNELLISNEIELEKSIIENFVPLLIEYFNVFDTSLFTSFFNFISTIHVRDINIEFINTNTKTLVLSSKELNKFNIDLNYYFFSEYSQSINMTKGMSIYNWFSSENEKELQKYLINKKCKIDIKETIEVFFKMVFLGCLDRFSWFLKGSPKNSKLFEKYELVFDLMKQSQFSQFVEKYGVDSDKKKHEIKYW